jgi:hypothetical protein
MNIREFLESIVDKPFRLKDQREADKTSYRFHRSGNVWWIQIRTIIHQTGTGKVLIDNWDHHCDAHICEVPGYILVTTHFLNEY